MQVTIEQIDAFARRVMLNLPDSLQQRKADLAVLIHILPPTALGHLAAKGMLKGLNDAEMEQAAFCFEKPNPASDGHNGGN